MHQEPYTQSKSAQPSLLQTYESLHFIVRGKNYEKLKNIAKISEDLYEKIMMDTNLFSFRPKEHYLITVYENPEEYYLNTGYPVWSGGGTVTLPLTQIQPLEKEIKSRTAIFTFEAMATSWLLAHEICHLIFNEFMEFDTQGESNKTRWLNEGLAVFEELEVYLNFEREAFLQMTLPLIKQNDLSLRTLLEFEPFQAKVISLGSFFYNGRTSSYTNIDLWYWGARSLVDFLIKTGGRYNFFLLLRALKQKKEFGAALNEAYPARWRDLPELESEWKRSLDIP